MAPEISGRWKHKETRSAYKLALYGEDGAACFVLASHMPSILDMHDSARLARMADDAIEFVGTKDKRNVGRSDAFAVQAGYRSGHNGNAQGKDLRWFIALGTQAATLEDLFNRRLVFCAA